MLQFPHEQIAYVAYMLWLAETEIGTVEDAETNWYKAEELLRAEAEEGAAVVEQVAGIEATPAI